MNKNNIFLYGTAVIKSWMSRIKKSPIAYRLAKGAFWSLVATLIARSSGVVAMIFVARFIGKIGMGEFGMIQSTVGIFSAVAGMGMGLTATKFVAEYKETDKIRAASMLGLSSMVTWISGILMTIVMFFMAPWFAEHTLAAPHLTGYLKTCSSLLLLGSINGAQTGALAGFEAFKSIARVSVISSALTFPLMVLGAFFFDLNGALGGLITSQALNAILNHLALRKEAAAADVRLWAPLQPGQWSVLWRFSLPSILCSMILGPVGWASSALLVNRPNGYAEMGIYNVTLSWFNVVFLIPSVLGQVILPMLASNGKHADKSNDKIVMLAVKANALAVIPSVFLISIFSPYIMSLYGAEFRSGWPTLVVTVFTSAVLAIQSPSVNSITASGRMWLIFAAYVFYGAAVLIMTFYLVRFGSFGVSSARLITYVLNGILVFWMATSLTKKMLPAGKK